MNKVKKNDVFKNLRSYSMILVLVAIAILSQVWTGGLTFTPRNLTNIIMQQSYIVILILGMLPVILTGNVDLSVASIMSFVGAVAAVLHVNNDWGTVPTILVSLVIGTAIGAWNGLWIAKFDIPAFIVTLSSQLVFRGMTQVVLDGASIGPLNESFRAISGSFITEIFGKETSASLAFPVTMVLAVVCCVVFVFSQISSRRNKIKHGVPVKGITGLVARCVVISAVLLALSYMLAINKGYPTVLVIMLVLTLLYSFICNRTVFGRSLYAVGGNRKAAALSGINDRKSLFMAYTNMGLISAVAAVVYLSRMDVATPKAATGYELDAIAACYVGGASVSGGAGTVSGALVGCLVIGFLNNAMSLKGISPDWQQAVKGLVILAAVAFDMIPKMRKK